MAAAEFATLADSLRARGVDPQRAAHFLMRLLFCLFAEDIGLLPPKLFSVLLERTRHRPADFKAGSHSQCSSDRGFFWRWSSYCKLTLDRATVAACSIQIDDPPLKHWA